MRRKSVEKCALAAGLTVVLASPSAGGTMPNPEASKQTQKLVISLAQQFPKSEVGSFDCAPKDDGVLCNNLVSFPKLNGGKVGANYIIHLDNYGAIDNVVAIIMSPAMAETKSDKEYMTFVFGAIGVGIIEFTLPDLPINSRIPLFLSAVKAGDGGVSKSGWTYSSGISLFASFAAKKSK